MYGKEKSIRIFTHTHTQTHTAHSKRWIKSNSTQSILREKCVRNRQVCCFRCLQFTLISCFHLLLFFFSLPKAYQNKKFFKKEGNSIEYKNVNFHFALFLFFFSFCFCVFISISNQNKCTGQTFDLNFSFSFIFCLQVRIFE